MEFRENTSDAYIFNEVVTLNEYGVTETFGWRDIVMDVGGHIGSFAYLVLTKGCKNVYVYEPDKSNYEVLARNMAAFGKKAHCLNYGLWRSDLDAASLPYTGYLQNGWNSAGGSVLCNTGTSQVPVRKFDEAIDLITKKGKKRIRVLKIDCEGSEYPIFYSSKKLHLIDTIYMEYHTLSDVPKFSKVEGSPCYDGATLINFLENQGFVVQYDRLGHVNKDGVPFGLAKLERVPKRACLSGRFVDRIQRLLGQTKPN